MLRGSNMLRWFLMLMVVQLTKTSQQTIIGSFKGFKNDKNGIKCDMVVIYGINNITLVNLQYNKTCEGLSITLESGSKEVSHNVFYHDFIKIQRLERRDVIIDIPEGRDIYDFNWIGFTCQSNMNTDRILLNHEALYFEIKPFIINSSKVRIGKILAVNENTLYITAMYSTIKPKYKAEFWILSNFNSRTNISSNFSQNFMNGESLYLHLPNNLTIHEIKTLAIYSEKINKTYGLVEFPTKVPKLTNIGNGVVDTQGRTIVRVPKCCPIGQIRISGGCTTSNDLLDIVPLRIHGTESQKSIIVPYFSPLNCNTSYILERDEFELSSSSRVIADEILTSDKYCIDSIEEKVELAFPCTDTTSTSWIKIICFICSIISVILLAFITAVVCKYKVARQTRGNIIVGYCISMTISFFMLAVSLSFKFSKRTCKTFDILYNLFLIASYVWLICFSHEMLYRIRQKEKQQKGRRWIIYLLLSVGIPIINTLLYFIIYQIKSDYFIDSVCVSPGQNNPFYYVPIIISIIVNSYFLVKIWRCVTNKPNPYPVVEHGINYKMISRSCSALLFLAAFFWITEFLNNFSGLVFFANGSKIVNHAQGCLIFLIFALQEPVKGVLKKIFSCKLFHYVPAPTTD